MIISPKKILEKDIVKPINKETQLQPNSIDLTVKEIRLIIDGGILYKDAKPAIYLSNKLEDYNERWKLEKNQAYDIVFNEYVKIPKGMVGFINCRSSLNRIGAFITTGLYDSGFDNYIGAVLRTDCKISIEKNARIATIFFVKAEEAKLYAGQYQGKKM